MNFPYHRCYGMHRQACNKSIPSLFQLFYLDGGTSWVQEIEEGSRTFCFYPCGFQSVADLYSSFSSFLPLLSHLLHHCCSNSALRRQTFSSTQRQPLKQSGAVEWDLSWLNIRDINRYLLHFRGIEIIANYPLLTKIRKLISCLSSEGSKSYFT